MRPASKAVFVLNLATGTTEGYSSIRQASEALFVDPKDLRTAIKTYPRVKTFNNTPYLIATDEDMLAIVPDVHLMSCEFTVVVGDTIRSQSDRLRDCLDRIGRDVTWYRDECIPLILQGKNHFDLGDGRSLHMHPKNADPFKDYTIHLPAQSVHHGR